MKKKKLMVIGLIIAFAVFFLYRYRSLNMQFPNPELREAYIGEVMEFEDVTFELEKVEILDGKDMNAIDPDIVIATDPSGKPFPDEKIRVVLNYIQIKNIGNKQKLVDFSRINAESGAWGNGINGEIFMALNPGVSVQKEIIKPGEVRNVVIPFSMLSTMFKERDWEGIDERVFSTVLNLYPEKIVLTGKKQPEN